MRGGLVGQTLATIIVVGPEAKLIVIMSFLPHPLEIPFPPARTVGFILITWLLVSPPQWILSALIKLKDSLLISIGLLRYHFPRLPFIFIKAPD